MCLSIYLYYITAEAKCLSRFAWHSLADESSCYNHMVILTGVALNLANIGVRALSLIY
jgi:hypothetical protein